MRTIALEIKELCQKNEDQWILDQVHFDVSNGERVAILGDANSGKEALFQLITNGGSKSGHISILGMNIENHREQLIQRIGVVSTDLSVDLDLSLHQSLYLQSKFHELPSLFFKLRREELLEAFGLNSVANEKIGYLSPSLRKRIHFIKAILHSPEILILDEPTMGLDPHEHKEILDILLQEKRKQHQTWMIFSSDYENIRPWCTRILFMNKGHVYSPFSSIFQREVFFDDEMKEGEVLEFSSSVPQMEYFRQRFKSQKLDYYEYHDQCCIFVSNKMQLDYLLDLLKGCGLYLRKPNLWDFYMKNSLTNQG